MDLLNYLLPFSSKSDDSCPNDLRETTDYASFKKVFPKRIAVVGRQNSVWDYVDSGLEDSDSLSAKLLDEKPPIIFVPGASGNEEAFFPTQLGLLDQGFRSVCVTTAPRDPPICYTYEWVEAFHEFIVAELELDRFHLVGAGLGAFLILSYIRDHPNNVASVVLTHGYSDTTAFHAPPPGPNGFIEAGKLRRHFLQNFINQESKTINDNCSSAILFMTETVESFCSQDLAGRMNLNCKTQRITNLRYDDAKITLVDVYQDGLDRTEEQRETLRKTIPGAKQHLLKWGGNFPYLSNPEEYTMAIRVHLRRHGFIEGSLSKLRVSEKQYFSHKTENKSPSVSEAEVRPERLESLGELILEEHCRQHRPRQSNVLSSASTLNLHTPSDVASANQSYTRSLEDSLVSIKTDAPSLPRVYHEPPAYPAPQQKKKYRHQRQCAQNSQSQSQEDLEIESFAFGGSKNLEYQLQERQLVLKSDKMLNDHIYDEPNILVFGVSHG